MRPSITRASRVTYGDVCKSIIAAQYLSTTVLLATVLFFAGTSAKFDQRHVRQSSLFFAVAVFLFAVWRMIALPVTGLFS